MTAICQV